jgi:hypothetical protein
MFTAAESESRQSVEINKHAVRERKETKKINKGSASTW